MPMHRIVCGMYKVYMSLDMEDVSKNRSTIIHNHGLLLPEGWVGVGGYSVYGSKLELVYFDAYSV